MKSILLVDDHKIVINGIKNILERNKYTVEICYCGEDAIKKIF